MSLKFRDKKKVVLLKSAWRRGSIPFAYQSYLTLCDSFIRKRHLVYRASAKDVLAKPLPIVEGLSFREVQAWEELRPLVRDYLLGKRELLQWGDPCWFDLGWRLWAGEFGEELATLCWWRSPKYSQDFFISIPEDAELMWQSTTLPQYRGRDLFTVQRLHLMRNRIEAGTNQFFVCCEDFNMTGRRNLPRQGFKHIGDSVFSKLTCRRVWYPDPS